jgi:hypothetical protein
VSFTIKEGLPMKGKLTGAFEQRCGAELQRALNDNPAAAAEQRSLQP